MKLPSLDALITEAYATLVRFPFVLLAAALATMSVIDRPDDLRFLLTVALGIPLFFAIGVYGERREWKMTGKIIGALVGAALLVGYYMTLNAGEPSDKNLQRFFIIALGLHFLTAIAPYLVRNQLQGFWQYNKTLFIRILTSFLYTGVLYIGLALALLAINELFDADIDGEIFQDLAAVLFGIFNTWFFLSGIPRNFNALQEDSSYPNGLKIFTQYVLLPLVVIYLVILYLYGGKIILEWEWPNGWVSPLILGFSVAGILSSLLLYPVRDREGNSWISRFYSGFYYALLPLTVLLVLAIWRRVSEYGITESRYYALALAVWLAVMAVYMLVTGARNIRAIPLSLCVLTFLSIFGPWGAFQVSMDSQLGELRGLLEKNGTLQNGAITDKKIDPDSDDARRIRSIVNYLDDHDDGLVQVAAWVGVSDTAGAYDILDPLGLSFNYAEKNHERQFRYLRHQTELPHVVDVAGFERFMEYAAYADGEIRMFELGGDSLSIWFDSSEGILAISRAGTRLVSADLNAHAAKLRRDFGEDEVSRRLLPEDLAITETGGGLIMKVQLSDLQSARMQSNTGPLEVLSFDAAIMVGRGDSAAAASMPHRDSSAWGTAHRDSSAWATPHRDSSKWR